MDDKKIVIGDEMIEAQLKQKSDKLNISMDELIDRYIMRGLFTDDYYQPPKLTREELLEISKKDVKKDMEKGILPQENDFDVFIGRWSKSE